MTTYQMAIDTQAHKLMLRIALKPKSKLTLECGTNPTNLERV